MITLTEIQAKQLRSTLSAALAVLDEKLTVQPVKKKKRVNRFDEQYATGKWKKPEHLKKRKI
jgi:hypothetical protein